jgi:hypothetical protein
MTRSHPHALRTLARRVATPSWLVDAATRAPGRALPASAEHAWPAERERGASASLGELANSSGGAAEHSEARANGSSSTVSGRGARVRIETADFARLELPFDADATARAALERSGAARANARAAGSAHARRWILDFRVAAPPADDLDGLARAALEPRASVIAAGELRALAERLRETLRDGAFDALERADGFELRPLRSPGACAVRLALVGEEFVCDRSVLADVDASVELEAVCDLALRLNERLRFARFAVHDRRLIVESALAARDATPRRLADSALAVVAAWRAGAAPLRALAEDRAVASRYVAALLQPTPRDLQPRTHR